MEGGSEAIIDMSGLSSNLELGDFGGVIEAVLPLVAIAVLVGFLFYTIRWCVGLFRGI